MCLKYPLALFLYITSGIFEKSPLNYPLGQAFETGSTSPTSAIWLNKGKISFSVRTFFMHESENKCNKS